MSKITLIELYDGVKASFSPNTYSRGNQAPPYALESLAGYLLHEGPKKGLDIDVNIIHERAVSKDKAYEAAGLEVGEKEKKETIQIGDQEILDMIKEKARQLKEGEPIIVGIRAVSMLYNYALELSQKIKREVPGVRIVVGGYHASELKGAVYESKRYVQQEQELRKDSKNSEVQLVDVFVVGEGEKTFLELIEKIGESQQDTKELQAKLREVDGMVFRDPSSNEVQITNKRERFGAKTGEAISLPPAYREISVPVYEEGKFSRSITVPSAIDCTQYATHPSADEIKGEIQISYSRGCPHDCPFCPSTGDLGLWGKKISLRDPKEVVAEIADCREKYGTNYIYFADLTFNYDPRKTNQLFDEMERYNKEQEAIFGGDDPEKIHWFALAEAFKFTKDNQDENGLRAKIDEVRTFLARMKEMGCAKLGIGVEGIMPEEMLSFKGNIGTSKEHSHQEQKWSKEEEFDKAADRAFNVLMSLKLTNDEGIFTRGYFLLGMPGQDEQTNEIMKALLSQEVPEEFFDEPSKLKVFLRTLFERMDEDRESQEVREGGFKKTDTADEIKQKISSLIVNDLSVIDPERKVKLVGVDHVRIVPVAYYYGTQLAEKQKLNYFDCYRDETTGSLYHDADGRPLPKLFKNGLELSLEQSEDGKMVYALGSESWTPEELKTDKEVSNQILGGEEGKTLHELVAEGFDDWDLLDYFKTKGSSFLEGTVVNFPFPEKDIVRYIYSSPEYKHHMERMAERHPFLKEAIISWENTLNKKGKEEAREMSDESRIFRFADEVGQERKEVKSESTSETAFKMKMK